LDAVPRRLNPLSKPPGGGGTKHIACSVRHNRTIRENTRMLTSNEVSSSCVGTSCAEVMGGVLYSDRSYYIMYELYVRLKMSVRREA